MDLYEGATSLSELQELNDSLRALAAVFPNVRPEVFREMLTTLSRESRTHVVAEHLLRSGDKWIKGRWRIDESRSSAGNTLGEVRHDNGQTARKTSKGNVDRPSQSEASIATNRSPSGERSGGEKGTRDAELELVPLPETFRSPSYKAAVFAALRHEFTGLSKSTINGVLAEQNHCYTLSRPILTDLASKTLRSSITNFVMRAFGFGAGAHGSNRGRNAPPPDESHFMLQWSSSSSSSSSNVNSIYGGHTSMSSSSYTTNSSTSGDKTFRIPSLRPTSSDELDLELTLTVLQPLLDRRRRREDQISLELAILLNEHEAEQAGAMYECQVCFGEAAWEQMAACTGSDDSHIICFECLQRSVSEAVYGQSWDLTIDHTRGQVACLAPVTSSTGSSCDGCIPQSLAERAILSAKGGAKMWQHLQSRLVDESLHRSGVPLIRCPFCPYAELDLLYLPSQPTWHLNLRTPLPTLLLLLLLSLDLAILASLLTLLLTLTIYLPLSSLLPVHFHPLSILSHLSTIWHSALATDTRRNHLSQRFVCRSPQCARASCLDCRRAWRDPHHCYEADAVSLRTTIEAARTAALKRTCPRCGVSFVKASGCNKMVCVCGYAMCYVCRQGLKGKARGRGADAGAGAGAAAGGGAGGGRAGPGDGVVFEAAAAAAENNEEGYRHFCQHFRPTGGACTECNRCDLYRAEDEDEAVRVAGEVAEAEWRARNGIAADVVLPGEGEQAKMRRGSWRGAGGGGGGGGGVGGVGGGVDGNTDRGAMGSVKRTGKRPWWNLFSISSRDVDAAIQRLFEWWIARVLASKLPVPATTPASTDKVESGEGERDD